MCALRTRKAFRTSFASPVPVDKVSGGGSVGEYRCQGAAVTFRTTHADIRTPLVVNSNQVGFMCDSPAPCYQLVGGSLLVLVVT